MEDERTFSSQLRHTCTAHVYKGQNVSLLSAFPLTCIHTQSSPPTPHGSLLSTDTFVKGYTLNLNICTHRVNCSLPPLKKQHSLLHTHTQMHTHTGTQTHTHTHTHIHAHAYTQTQIETHTELIVPLSSISHGQLRTEAEV